MQLVEYISILHQLQRWHSIPDDLIINFDQNPLSYVVTGNSTLDEKGVKYVPLQGKGKKKQITGTFAISIIGDFLPVQLIYDGKTPQCLPKDVEFPKEFDVTLTPNHWSKNALKLDFNIFEGIFLCIVAILRFKNLTFNSKSLNDTGLNL